MSAEVHRSALPMLGIAALLLGSASGCAGMSLPLWVRQLTFNKEDVDPRGNLAPYKVVEALQKERRELSSWPVERQQAKAAELAAMYRNEADPLVRREIVRTIAQCGSPDAAATLTAAMQDGEVDVRSAVCDAWADHGGPQAAPSLSGLLRQDRSADVRLAAARALGRMKGPEAAQALGQALDDPAATMQDPAMQYRLVQSLRQTTGKDFGDSPNLWREFLQGGSPPEISTAQRMKLDYF